MFIRKAQNIVVYQEFVVLCPRPEYNMIHRQKNGRSRQLAYNKLNTWVRKVELPKLKVTGNSFGVFNPWRIDRQTGSHHFWIWKHQVSLFVIQRGWNNSEYLDSFRDVWSNSEVFIHSEVYSGIMKCTGIHEVFISVIAEWVLWWRRPFGGSHCVDCSSLR